MVAKVNLLIGTPAVAGQVHVDYLAALLEYRRQGLPFTLLTVGNESLLTRARNTIISAFHARGEFSHLLFLDAEVYLPHEGLVHMLECNKDVIGAPVALKRLGPDGARLFNVGRAQNEDGPLIVVERVGAAALLLSRAAANALVAEAKRAQRVYEDRPTAFDGGNGSVQYDVFRVGVVDGDYLSEDSWICHELRRLGFLIHVDPTLVTRRGGA
ncbi:MAG TPA: hypothetical protein VG425_16290 [Casimicrobiaceae bacterium]|nr:hypothetical protein [Casimicrobiaceae bacterium]